MFKKIELDFHGRPLTIEVGRVAKQADGAAWVRYGETVVLGDGGRCQRVKTRN